MKNDKLTCTKCKQEKETDLFPPNKNVSTGRSSWCRQCTIAQSMLNQQLKREERRQQKRKQEKVVPIMYADYLHNENLKKNLWKRKVQTLRTQ